MGTDGQKLTRHLYLRLGMDNNMFASRLQSRTLLNWICQSRNSRRGCCPNKPRKMPHDVAWAVSGISMYRYKRYSPMHCPGGCRRCALHMFLLTLFAARQAVNAFRLHPDAADCSGQRGGGLLSVLHFCARAQPIQDQ